MKVITWNSTGTARLHWLERRARRTARHAGYHALARVEREPGAALVCLAALAALCMVLASMQMPVTYAYFHQVTREEIQLSFAEQDTGVVLKGQQTCTAFEPPAAGVEALGSGSLESLPQVWVETCVENQGEETTEGLEITAILQVKDGADFRELQRQPVDVSAQPDVKSGAKQCYAYPIAAAYDPQQIYRSVAQISVTNLRGWLPGSDNCPGEDACRKGVSASAEFRVPADAFPSPSPTPSKSPTLTPSESPTPTVTETPVPSEMPEPSLTPTPGPSETPQPTVTPVTPVVPQPTETPVTPVPSETPVPALPSETPMPPPTEAPVPSDTPMPPPTEAPAPTEAPMLPPTEASAPSEEPVITAPQPPTEAPVPSKEPIPESTEATAPLSM